MNLIGWDETVNKRKAGLGMYVLALPIFSNGYRWDDAMEPHGLFGGGKPPWLTPNETDSYFISYPLNHRDLHRQFAKLSGELKDIEEFANKHGFLGHPLYLQEKGRRLTLKDGLTDGEPLAFWQEEITRMKNLLDLWNAVCMKNEVGLKKELKWRKSRLSLGFEWQESYHEVIDYMDLVPSPAEKHKGDKLRLVRHYVVTEVNKNLRGHCNGVLVEMGEKYSVQMAPDCLLSAMYTLFADEIEGFDPNQFQVSYPKRRCKNPDCFGLFAGRLNRQYCSTSCKKHMKHLRRKARLAKAGKS